MKLKSIAAASMVAFTALGSHAADTSWGSHALLESALGLTAGGVIFDTFSFSLGAQSSVASSVTSLGPIGAGTGGRIGGREGRPFPPRVVEPTPVVLGRSRGVTSGSQAF